MKRQGSNRNEFEPVAVKMVTFDSVGFKLSLVVCRAITLGNGDLWANYGYLTLLYIQRLGHGPNCSVWWNCVCVVRCTLMASVTFELTSVSMNGKLRERKLLWSVLWMRDRWGGVQQVLSLCIVSNPGKTVNITHAVGRSEGLLSKRSSWPSYRTHRTNYTTSKRMK